MKGELRKIYQPWADKLQLKAYMKQERSSYFGAYIAGKS